MKKHALVFVVMLTAFLNVSADEQTPQKQIENIIPILFAKDMDASAKYYVDVLGFDKGWQSENFAMVSRDEFRIYLSTSQGKPGSYLWVGVQDVDVFHQEYKKSGAEIIQPPKDMGHALEMHVRDPSGNIVRFGS